MYIYHYSYSECISIAASYFREALRSKYNPSRLEHFTIEAEHWFGNTKIARREGLVSDLSIALERIKK